MAEHRIVLIESPGYLSINLGRLCIEQTAQPARFILPQDIDVLCLHNAASNISTAALHTLASHGVITVVTDAQHDPCAMLYPLKTHVRQGLRLRRQIAFDQDHRKASLWQQIIRAKIQSQAFNLRARQRNGALYLERMVSKVLPGDEKNHEGQAARHYWKHLFKLGHQRIKQGAKDSINAHLNYGYAVLRAMLTRQLAASGLNLALGIGHHSAENPFNLADDFIEPYRFLVERQVATMEQQADPLPALGSAGKQQLLGFITTELTMQDGDYRLATALEKTVSSYCQILHNKGQQLALPVY